MLFKRLTIIGIGLIGGSLARAARRAGACEHIIGWDLNADELDKALDLGVIDEAATSIEQAVISADLLVLAVPLGALPAVMDRVRSALDEHTVITDVGSAKAVVVEQARAALGEHFPRFVPGHPVAGTEKGGVAASFPELFEQHRVILTPVPETRSQAVTLVEDLWKAMGAMVERMEVHRHDEVLAATSHLPHVLSYGLVHSLATLPESEEVFRYAAGGFRDFTRIASSSPLMWQEIILANREALLAIMEKFSLDLAQLTEAIRQADGDEIMRILQLAKAARDEFASGQVGVMKAGGGTLGDKPE